MLLWRRCAALAYDALLLAALWLITAMAVRVFAGITRMQDTRALMQVALVGVGMVFFAWFWSHGGQTLGMRAWRLRVERAGGTPVPFGVAMLRYLAGLIPLICALSAVPHLGMPALALAAAVYLPCLFAGGGRAFNDLIAGTRVVLLPKRSAQLAQAP